MLRSILLLALPILYCIGCSKKTDEHGITGTWEWKQTSGTIAGRVVDSTYFGHRQQLRLTSNGKYTFYVNGLSRYNGTYTVDPGQTTQPYRQATITFSPSFIGMVSSSSMIMAFSVEDNNLLLSDRISDGLFWYFSRK